VADPARLSAPPPHLLCARATNRAEGEGGPEVFTQRRRVAYSPSPPPPDQAERALPSARTHRTVTLLDGKHKPLLQLILLHDLLARQWQVIVSHHLALPR
jgi:hypothetical protein